MSYQVAIDDAAPRPVAGVRFRVTDPDQIAGRMGEAFGAVMRHLARSGVETQGPAFAVYDILGNGEFDVLAGFVVPSPVEDGGGVEAAELPGGSEAWTMHVGPYASLPEAYEAIRVHVESHGGVLSPDVMWEEYLSPPDTSPEETLTVVHWPLASEVSASA